METLPSEEPIQQTPNEPVTPLDIISKYEEYASLRKTGKLFGISHETVSNILKRHKIKRKAVGGWEKLKNNEQTHICSEYNKGISITQLAKNYNVCPQTISRILKKNKITEIRNRKHNLNEKVFDKLTNESSYWLGVMFGRGTPKSEYHLELVYSEPKHQELIRKLKKFLETNQPPINITIKRPNRLTYSHKRLVLGSKYLVKQLTNLGVYPISKITYPKYFNENKHLQAEFIRGYIDARGKIDQKNSIIKINSNYEFLLDVQKVILQYTEVTGKITKKTFNPIYATLVYTGKETNKVLQFLLSSKKGNVTFNI